MSIKEELWVEKYRPKKLGDILGNKENIEKMKLWLRNFKNNLHTTKKIMLLSGEPGIGKTSTAHMILKEFGYSIIEHNASDIRGGKTMNDVIKRSLTYTNILDIMNGNNRPIAIIMDEIDNLVNGGSERGGLSSFLDIIKSDTDVKSRIKKNEILIYNPIICIYNEFSNKKLNELKKYAECITFENPKEKDIMPLLNKILNNEKMSFDEEAKKEIIKYCDSDIRRLLNLLQFISYSCKNKVTLDKIKDIEIQFGEKDKSFDMKNEIIKVLTEDISIDDGINIAKQDQFRVPLFLYEHSLNFIKHKTCTHEEKINIYYDILDSFTKNDIIQTNIFVNHYWDLYKYSSLYGCCNINKIINTKKFERKFNKKKKNITFPTILTKISQKGSNKKMVINIINKLKHIDVNLTLNKLKILSLFIYQNLFSTNRASLIKLCKYMKLKNIKYDDIEIILKLRKFYTICLPKNKKLPKKRKDLFKEIYYKFCK
jgi:replication factor C subunit 1